MNTKATGVAAAAAEACDISLSVQAIDGSFSEESYVRAAYRWADTMLRERLRNGAASGCESVQSDHIPDAGKMAKTSTNHDAAPAARASVGRPRTDKADLPTRCGTGDKPVTEPLPVFASGSGSVTPVSYEKSDEKRVLYDTKSPRNGALSGCETVPDPDSRVWETPCTPQPHAIPAKGSVQGDGSVPDSRNANEPVAWAVMYPNGEFGILAFYRREAEDRATASDRVVPLYRSPTLTDAEREAVVRALSYVSAAEWEFGSKRDAETAATLRGLLERM